ncbi:MAG: asparagine synthase (glutamine-hydrolyzing) [Proteobacteria bacterium]|nr:asparagine synthase (glutamine-hydrolyzing) [Pseudomonadota bacterium]
MCGIAGLVQRQPSEARSIRFRSAALRSLGRRGPDDFRFGDYAGAEMIHTRLSIIDLMAGQQPMEDEKGALAFNGEIYNHADLHIPGIDYPNHSDTLVLLRGLGVEGVPFLDKADGMFAFGYLNKAKRKLYLARDAFGIKPVYYILKPEAFAFSSTIPALMTLSDKNINPQGYYQFYVGRGARGANTLFDDVHEVPPGHVAIYDLDSHSITVERWYNRPDIAVSDAPEAELLDRLDAILNFSIRRHLVSDVPVAALLSGGIDSGLTTAIASKYVENLACFSIGFRDKRYDESPYSEAIARKFGLRHFVKFVDGNDLVGMLESWPIIADDASAEPASVMRYLVARYAHDNGFKVVLSGEGADEFFGGYNQYYRFQLAQAANRIGRFVPFLAPLARQLLWPRTRLIHYIGQAVADPRYTGTSMVFEPFLLKEVFRDDIGPLPSAGTLRDALFLDQTYRLPDDLLTITDRATMHASIEARVPFITRYVADFAASLPDNMIVNGKKQKYLLRQLALRYLPAECVERPKVGFDMPLGRWLRNELRPLVEETLATTWQRDFLKSGAMEKVVAAHMSGKADFADKIWAFITLERNVNALRAIN